MKFSVSSNNISISIFILFVLFFHSSILLSQRKYVEGNKILSYDKSDNLSQIEFLDSTTKQVKNQYNVKNNNPYMMKSDSGGDIKLLKSDNHILYSYFIGEPNCVICYETFSAGKTADKPSSVKAICYIVNKEGKIAQIIPENKEGYNNPVVTKDGNYVGVLYGTSDPHMASSSINTSGFKIFDVKNRAFILNLRIPIGGPVVVDDKIIVTTNNGKVKTYKVFVPAKKIYFENSYSRDQRKEIRFENSGFVIKNEVGLDEFESYVKFFKTYPF